MAVPAHFTVEFLGFLVFTAGAILAFTRADLIPGESSNRITAAIGFGALAAAQVLHGGSFSFGRLSAEQDGATILIGLKAVGLAFVVIGIVGSLKSFGAPAVAGWQLREPLLLAPAVAGILLFFAALGGSKTQRSLRRLAVFGLLFGAAEVLTAAAPGAVFGTRTVTIYAYAAHGVKALSFFALASWIWAAVRASIRTRFVASFAALLVAVVLLLSTALTGVISSSVETEELERLADQVDAAVLELNSDLAEELKQDAASLASDSVVVRQRVSNRTDLPGLAADIRSTEALELSHGFVMVMDPRGRVLGFSGEGPALGRRSKATTLRRIDVVTINGSALIGQVVDRGFEEAAGPDRVGEDLIALVAVHEVTDVNQPTRRAGVLAVGRWIDKVVIEGIGARAGAKAAIVVDGRTVATTLRNAPRRGLIPASLRNQIQSCPPDEPVTGQIAVGNLSYFSAFECLENARGIATIVLAAPARSVIETRGLFTRILFLIAMGVGAVSLVLAWFSGRAITRPIQELTIAAGAVREGNLQAQAPVRGEDEVGQLGETFNEMTASLYRMTNDLRQAAREEHALRARIETIIESMADGLVAVDAERNILAFNPAAEEITGVEAAGVIGRPVQEVLDARDAQGKKVSLPIFDLIHGSVDGIYLARPGTDPVPVAVVSAVLPAPEGGPSGGVAVLRDMTREREVERMKSEFLSNISHELRTPLTPIKGYAEILGKKDIPPEKAQKFAGGILESTARLERIVALLVDFSAMEAGRLSPKSTSVDIASLVSNIAKDWEARTSQHSVSIEIPASLPPVVGDERLLRRSIEEVLDNAVKVSPRGGAIRVEAHRRGSGNGAAGQIAISISDEGIGISPEDVGRIFSDFQQLDGSETRAYGGLGLGLAFVRRIIEAHDGSIDVKSVPDRGTTFTITIPAGSAPPQPEGS